MNHTHRGRAASVYLDTFELDAVVVAVSLDPFHPREAAFELPLWQLGLPDHGTVSVEDLVRDRRFVWTGKMQSVRLDPADMPFSIWRVAPLSEHGP
jgi:starch synthase (maltosyl-transferring)